MIAYEIKTSHVVINDEIADYLLPIIKNLLINSFNSNVHKINKINWRDFIPNLLPANIKQIYLNTINQMYYRKNPNGKYSIIFDNKNVYYNVKQETIFKLLNWGTMSFTGLRLIEKSMNDLEQNIDIYLEEHMGG